MNHSLLPTLIKNYILLTTPSWNKNPNVKGEYLPYIHYLYSSPQSPTMSNKLLDFVCTVSMAS